MDNRERDKARDKNRRTQISLEEKQKNFIAAVREKEEMLAATKVKMSGIQHFLHNSVTGKFLEVSRCIRSKEGAKLFFAN